MWRTGWLLSMILMLSASSGAAATIRDAYTRHMDVGQFQLLREFFTGVEATGNRSVLRTDPNERTGQYFVVELDTPVAQLPAGSRLVLEVVSTDALKAEQFEFALAEANKPKSGRVFLGLTGAAWPTEERKALAWRLRLLQGETVLSEWKSFLWEMP